MIIKSDGNEFDVDVLDVDAFEIKDDLGSFELVIEIGKTHLLIHDRNEAKRFLKEFYDLGDDK